ncbi:MAG: hypothetical protein U0263_39795 [Polyangiaceae bacterium]
MGLGLAALGFPLLVAAALPAFVASHGELARGTGFMLAAVAGVIPGAQLAAAGRLSSGSGGALYAADLAGAALASVLTLTFAVPALGLGGTLVLLALIKVPSAIFVAWPMPAGRWIRRSVSR